MYVSVMKMTKMQQYIAADTSKLNREAQNQEVKTPKQQSFREQKVTATSQVLYLLFITIMLQWLLFCLLLHFSYCIQVLGTYRNYMYSYNIKTILSVLFELHSISLSYPLRPSELFSHGQKNKQEKIHVQNYSFFILIIITSCNSAHCYWGMYIGSFWLLYW